ncbi:STAS domain-containing protein [Nodularia harveyana UHCC-0300]|uniref:Anti-sigma factor antagonist n=1 Tax=Nodularia harveyana UHCC-0300 TaxID=2974287 RepID=A0ABU5UC28_9CYAN|nr:STAS domain-containing protein [Nodularia harveyana]MEA5580933.1 STAS domain-containing protein [Nodularia harveyana UHCC-0300]
MNPTVKVIEPSGILNAINGNEIRREITYLISTGADIVLIDFENVNFIDSSGLGALVASMQAVKQENGELFICSVNAQVKMIFELTKMDRLFKVFANRDEFNTQVLATQ